MITLNDIDTSLLKFDVKSKDFIETISNKIPHFSKYNGSINKKKLFTYIVLMYDYNSPMLKEQSDYYLRKYECVMLSGFNFSNEGHIVGDIEKVALGDDIDAYNLITSYIVSFSSPEYHELMMLLHMRDVLSRKIFSNNFNPDIHKHIESISEKIKIKTREIYHSGDYDETELARKSLYAMVDSDRLRISPEDRAEYIADGGLPKDWNPYGIDYIVDDLKFIGDSESSAKTKLSKKNR